MAQNDTTHDNHTFFRSFKSPIFLFAPRHDYPDFDNVEVHQMGELAGAWTEKV